MVGRPVTDMGVRKEDDSDTFVGIDVDVRGILAGLCTFGQILHPGDMLVCLSPIEGALPFIEECHRGGWGGALSLQSPRIEGAVGVGALEQVVTLGLGGVDLLRRPWPACQ